ncbi:MAG: signal recognition particle-docking protein FtsY [Beijerinckiaceae bacterium]
MADENTTTGKKPSWWQRALGIEPKAAPSAPVPVPQAPVADQPADSTPAEAESSGAEPEAATPAEMQSAIIAATSSANAGAEAAGLGGVLSGMIPVQPSAPPMAPAPAAPLAAPAAPEMAAPEMAAPARPLFVDAATRPVETPAETPKLSWWQRLKTGLARSSSSLSTGITDLFTKKKLDAQTLDDFEDILIQADLGTQTASRITDAIGSGRFGKDLSADAVRAILASEVEATLAPVAKPLVIDSAKKPFVILMIGVNGAGKTTTIGKLAQKLTHDGKRVMLAAGDTFRAAAIEQLKIWGERTGSAVITRPQGSDASGLVYDAIESARAENSDILLIDTAGRLQNKTALMDELAKIVRVIKKADETAPHAVLLVLDATVGQNALQQVELFTKVAGVTGIVMTKLDGTARGGILVAIAAKFKMPVHFIGVGEKVEDLEPFTARDFARAIAGLEDTAN